MNLYEYQAKKVFAKYEIPIPKGKVMSDQSQLQEALETIGVDKFGVVKAQVLTGGRGKAGGIKAVDSIQQGQEAVRAIMAMKIKGVTVDKVLVEEKLKIKNEYFISVTIDPEELLPALLISPKGGMDIEEIARVLPEALGKYVIEPQVGLRSFAIIDLVKKLDFQRVLWGGMNDIADKLYKVFSEKEAILAEINPLIETMDGELIAADGRLNIDDNALFRHEEFSQFKKESKETALKEKGVDYVDLGEGEVGLLCAGAGMSMLSMDLVAQLGSKARCFLDMSRGVNPIGFEAGINALAFDPDIKYVLMNMFGGLTRMDEIARSLLQAIDSLGGQFSKPIIMRMQGTNVEEGQRIMREAGYEVYSELEDVMNRLKRMLEDNK